MLNAKTQPVRVLMPHEGLGAFREAIHSMVRDWPTTKTVAWRMFVRDTTALYRQSLLGYLWLLLPSLANTLVWVFLNEQNVVKIDTGNVPYPLFVFAGTILWTGFNGSMLAMLGVIEEAKGTLAKVNFPHESLVIAAFSKSLLNTGATGVFLVPFLFLYHVDWSWTMLLFPVGLLATMLCGAAIGLAAAPFTSLISDLNRGIQLVLRFGFFLTPVIFSLPSGGWGRTLMLLNPATPLFVTSRSWLLGGEPAMTAAFAIVSLASILTLFASVILLKVALPHIIERISGG